MPIKCSVVCCTYNHERFAEAALKSVFAQTQHNLEVVVIDDGSTDSTVAIVEATLAQSPFPTKLLTQRNTGNVPKNFNRAIRNASGDFLAFLSLDDMLHPTSLETRIAAIEEDDSLAFAADTRFDEIDETGATARAGLPTAIHGKDVKSGQDLLECEFVTLGSFYIQCGVFRKAVVDAVGAFDEDMIGDDINLRTKIFRHIDQTPRMSFRLMDGVGFRYRKHKTNLHLNTERQIRTIIQWRNRYFPGRPLPVEGVAWIRSAVQNALAAHDAVELSQLLRLTIDEVDFARLLLGLWETEVEAYRATSNATISQLESGRQELQKKVRELSKTVSRQRTSLRWLTKQAVKEAWRRCLRR